MPDRIVQRLARLEAEADIRRLAARYMALCDQPPTNAPGADFEDLFTKDVIWEGVGRKAGSEFARVEGRDALLSWFDSMRVPPKYAFNVHFLTSETIHVADDQANGTWVMFQTATRATGEAEFRMARVTIRFRYDDDDWRIMHFQTESLFRHDVPAGQVATLLDQLKA